MTEESRAEACLHSIRLVRSGRQEEAAEILTEIPLLNHLASGGVVEMPRLLKHLAELLQAAALRDIRAIEMSGASDLVKGAQKQSAGVLLHTGGLEVAGGGGGRAFVQTRRTTST